VARKWREQKFIVHFNIDTCCKALRAAENAGNQIQEAGIEVADSRRNAVRAGSRRMAEGLLKELKTLRTENASSQARRRAFVSRQGGVKH
jgi:hypothetical protein